MMKTKMVMMVTYVGTIMMSIMAMMPKKWYNGSRSQDNKREVGRQTKTGGAAYKRRRRTSMRKRGEQETSNGNNRKDMTEE